MCGVCMYVCNIHMPREKRNQNTYISSGLNLCMTAQNASPFLQDVVMLVILTPRYPLVTSLHQVTRS